MDKISRRQFINNSIKGTILLVPAGSGLLLLGSSGQKEYDVDLNWKDITGFFNRLKK